jgi:hypothetical protein
LAVGAKAADIDARIGVQAAVLADVARRLAQVDTAVEGVARRGRGAEALDLVAGQRKNRAELAAARVVEAKALAGLQVERAAVDGQRRVVEADLGPVRYLAQLIGATDEQTMRWFVLAVALLLDPGAVLLLLAATRRAA